MQVGSLGDDTKMLKAIGETSEGMAVDTHVEEAQADAAAAAVPDEAARMAEGKKSPAHEWESRRTAMV